MKNMRRPRRISLRYGLASAGLVFLGGWAVTALLIPETPFSQAPRWKGVLWVYLGAHLLEISNIHTGGAGLGTVQPLSVVEAPATIFAVPPLAAAVAALYTCYQVHSSKFKHNVSNAISAGMGYFLIALFAIFISNARPNVSFIIGIALLVGGGLWIGSTFISAFGGGLPFIGIASFGTVAALGVLLLMGGIAVASAIWGVVVVSFGGAGTAGIVIGANRHIESKGSRKGADFPRLHGLKLWLKDNWLELVAVIVVITALFIGLTGTETPLGSN